MLVFSHISDIFKRGMSVYKIKKQKYSFKKNGFKKIVLKSLIFISPFLIIFSIFLYLPKLKIKEIEINGNENLTGKTRIIVNEELNKKILFLIPKNNFFIFKKSNLKEKILQTITSIKTVEINKNFPDTIILNIKERTEVGAYCADEEMLKCFSLDEEAMIFEERAVSGDEKKLIFIASTSTTVAKQNERVVDKKTFAELLYFSDSAEKIFGLKARKIILNKNEYNVFFENSFYVIINKEQINSAFENLKLILESQIRDKKNNLEYIDLRFQNKAFFKLRK